VQAEVARLTSDGDTPTAPTSTTIPGANAVTVDLFDGTGSAGLAAQAQTLLQGKGFQVGTATKLSNRSTTVIRYNPADDAALAAVRQVLGPDMQAEPDRDVASGHVRVLLGKDFSSAVSAAKPIKPVDSTSTANATPTPTAPPITAGGIPCVN
jgi:hypothetical protein